MAPETTFSAGGFDSQMVDGAGDTNFGDDDGGFVSSEGEFEEPQSSRERGFRVPFNDAPRQPSSADFAPKLHLMLPAKNRVSFCYTLLIFFPQILFSNWNCLGKLFYS
jgi:hypothetical protein